MALSATSTLRVFGWLLATAIVVLLCFVNWGSELLTVNDPQPSHVDAAIVLQGSAVAEKVRIAGAMNLLREGIADRVLLSVPKESYWGQSIPPVARAYFERNYGSDLSARVVFCETAEDVNSTEQEAEALSPCIREQHWQSLLIVTSNYHTRRARMIWKRITRHDSELHLWIHGVTDPEFQQPWWRHRQSAKIFAMECSKLAWSLFE